MATPVTCKFDEDPIKIEGTIDLTRSNMGFFATQGQVTPKWIVRTGQNSNVQDFMAALVTYKIDEDPTKTEGTIDRTRTKMAFFGSQWQATP